tara:strand:+ start:294 stop:1382 length:1089 start_codon:yes stop_codon:yes gene_type:complete
VKIIYIYSKGRKERLSCKDKVPSEFFYGFMELKNYFKELYFFEEKELGMQLQNNLLGKFFRKLSLLSIGLPLEMLFGFLINKSFKKFKDNEILVATTNGIGLTLSIAKTFGLIKSPIIFISMGLLSSKVTLIKKFIYEFILKNIFIIFISKSEEKYFKKLMPSLNVSYIPFGIDNTFWIEESSSNQEEYALGIGNDLARDWDILIKAWEDSFPKLKIITSQNLSTNKINIEIIKGSWRDNLLTDKQIRKLYGSACFTIIPLKETIQPSGQSACLQAMSCNKSVIMSDIIGKWDSTKLIHKKNIYLVKPSSISSLNLAIKDLIRNKKLNTTIAKNGKKMVDKFYHREIMAKSLIPIFERISAL